MPSTGPTRTASDADRPRLATGVRLAFDQARERHVLLAPERISVLNGTGAAIVDLCDGQRTVAEIVAELHGRYAHVAGDDVRFFIAQLAAKRLVEVSHA